MLETCCTGRARWAIAKFCADILANREGWSNWSVEGLLGAVAAGWLCKWLCGPLWSVGAGYVRATPRRIRACPCCVPVPTTACRPVAWASFALTQWVPQCTTVKEPLSGRPPRLERCNTESTIIRRTRDIRDRETGLRSLTPDTRPDPRETRADGARPPTAEDRGRGARSKMRAVEAVRGQVWKRDPWSGPAMMVC